MKNGLIYDLIGLRVVRRQSISGTFKLKFHKTETRNWFSLSIKQYLRLREVLSGTKTDRMNLAIFTDLNSDIFAFHYRLRSNWFCLVSMIIETIHASLPEDQVQLYDLQI